MAKQERIPTFIYLLLVLFLGALWLRIEDPITRRAPISSPSFWSRRAPPPVHARLDPTKLGTLEARPPARSLTPLYPEWFRDISDGQSCGYERDLEPGYQFKLNLREGEGGLLPLLSTKELLLLAWVSHRYQINPHFLLGIMDAESSGDCSAVSIAGAQGCFQITDSFGANQLNNTFPERMTDWHWATRSLANPSQRPWPPEAKSWDYYPQDIYVSPDEWFKELAPEDGGSPTKAVRARRQLRSLIDPVATEIESPRFGLVNVSSVASFNFGVIGSALYFHWQNAFLYEQGLIHDDIAVMTQTPGLKALWMAAAYNQGFNRSLRQLVQSGAAFPQALRADVRQYAEKVTYQCHLLEEGTPTPDSAVTWEIFLDFMQELRWTYSDIPVEWDRLFPTLKERHFRGGPIPLSEVPRVFDDMAHLEPNLRPEIPIFDYKGGYESLDEVEDLDD